MRTHLAGQEGPERSNRAIGMSRFELRLSTRSDPFRNGGVRPPVEAAEYGDLASQVLLVQRIDIVDVDVRVSLDVRSIS